LSMFNNFVILAGMVSRGLSKIVGCQKLKMEATRSDFDVLPFL
jgi:hypothetical protein